MLAREVPLLTYRFVGYPLAPQDFYRERAQRADVGGQSDARCRAR
jgi:hypothetical protein